MTPWFKFYGGEYLSDTKMDSLSPCERSCWLTILCYASIEGDGGKIRHTDEAKIMLRSGLDQSRDEWDETKGFLNKFKKLGMIRLDNGMITVINWQKRQCLSMSAYERVKRFREKKRNDNAMITPMITVEVDREVEVDKDILLRKDKSSYSEEAKWVSDLFQGLKDSKIEITDASMRGGASERIVYPKRMRKKNPDVNYWISVARFSQSFNFRKGDDYVFPWKGPIKLSKIFFEVEKKFAQGKSADDGRRRLAEMKKQAFKKDA